MYVRLGRGISITRRPTGIGEIPGNWRGSQKELGSLAGQAGNGRTGGGGSGGSGKAGLGVIVPSLRVNISIGHLRDSL